MNGVGTVIDVMAKFPLYKACPICSRSLNTIDGSLISYTEDSILRCTACSRMFPSDAADWKFKAAVRVNEMDTF
jgi:uncharacterized Zn finger protein